MKKKYNVNVCANVIIPIVIESDCNSEKEAITMARNKVFEILKENNNIQNVNITGCGIKVTMVDETIMNNSNNHNKELVKKINDIYNNNILRDHFYKIVKSLMERDIEELETFECTEIDDLEILNEDYIYDYLMHVADDRDLETIISFIR